MRREDDYEDKFDSWGIKPELHPILSFLADKIKLANHDYSNAPFLHPLPIIGWALNCVDFKGARLFPAANEVEQMPVTVKYDYYHDKFADNIHIAAAKELQARINAVVGVGAQCDVYVYDFPGDAETIRHEDGRTINVVLKPRIAVLPRP